MELGAWTSEAGPSADSRQLEENAAAQPLWRNKAWDRPGAANEILKEHFDVILTSSSTVLNAMIAMHVHRQL